MKPLSWILLPLALVLMTGFAIANRHGVAISLDPFPLALDAPLYGVIFAAVFVGLLLGGLAAWWRQRRWRREARWLRREVKRLKREAEAAEAAPAASAGTAVIEAKPAPLIDAA